MTKQIKVAELFAGMGGIGLGFQQAGFDIVWANEIDPKACITYKANFNHTLINQDMRKINTDEIPPIDILGGGFPCQAFSIAGNLKGFKDERGNMFFEILRFIQAKQPKVIFLENVKNLCYHDKGNTLKTIINHLEQLGYNVAHKILRTSNYSNLPQSRDRVYIVCFKDKQSFDKFKYPEEVAETLRTQELLDSPETIPEEFFYDNFKHANEVKQAIEDGGVCSYDWGKVIQSVGQIAPTLLCGNRHLTKQQGRLRKLTPRECARLQGFPNDFILPKELSKTSLYKQIGNSVSVPVIQRIAKQIKEALEG